MAEVLGVGLPDIDVTGFFASTWIYVFIVGAIGLILVVGVALLLFFRTFNKKVILFDNISGLGWQPVARRRARTLRVSNSGEELLALIGGETMTHYGRKMGSNTYWFARSQDGYWINFLLGDLDVKLAMLDIEPVNTDVRMFHVAKDRMNRENYLKRSFLEKYGATMIMFFFLIAFILGMWFIVGKIGDATTALSATAQTNADVAKATSQALQALANIQGGGTTSGIVPVG